MIYLKKAVSIFLTLSMLLHFLRPLNILAVEVKSETDSQKKSVLLNYEDNKNYYSVNKNGNTYQIFDYNYSWFDAKSYCESIGGHLATITSREEQLIIEDLIASDMVSDYYWIGATDEECEGEWKWLTNEEFTYNKWHGGNPDNYNHGVNYGGYENYLGIWGIHDADSTRPFGYWNDFSYVTHDSWRNYSAGFICEWEANIDPIVESHIEWLKNNNNKFEYISDSSLLSEIRNILMNNSDVDRYKYFQFLAEDKELYINGELGEKYTVGLVLAELFSSQEYQECLNEAALLKQYEINKKIVDTTAVFLNGLDEYDDVKDSINDLRIIEKSFKNSNKASIISNSKKIMDAYAEKAKWIFDYEGLSDEIRGILGPIVDQVSSTFDYKEKSKLLNDEYYKYIQLKCCYEGQTEYTKQAIKFLIEKVNNKSILQTGNDPERIAKIQSTLNDIYYNINLSYDELVDEYENLRLSNTADYINQTIFNIGKAVSLVLITSVAPEIAAIIVAYDIYNTGKSLYGTIGMKCNSEIKELAFSRDVALNLMILNDAVVDAMNNNINKDLVQMKNIDSVEVFENGFVMYKKIHNLTLDMAKEYIVLFSTEMNKNLAYAKDHKIISAFTHSYSYLIKKYYYKLYGQEELLSVLDCESIIKNTPEIYLNEYTDKFDINLFIDNYHINKKQLFILESKLLLTSSYINELEKENNKLNELYCHYEPIKISYTEIKDTNYQVYTIACPINIKVSDSSGECIVRIDNDNVYYCNDNPGCIVYSINDGSDLYNSKIIIAPSDYGVEISGYDDGLMTFSKCVIENDNCLYNFSATDIPVKEHSTYSEEFDTLNGILNFSYNLNDDSPEKMLTVYNRYIEIGDVNEDGVVDLVDLTMLSLTLLKDYVLNDHQKNAADVDRNGEIDITDLARLKQYVTKEITHF